MRVTFVGCGDAFGSGARFNTCFHVATAATHFLIDCGASSLIAMKRLGVDRDAIDLILVTHFHADHFGGVPFFILDAALVAKRTRPLVIAGPPGLPDWFARVTQTAFPGERTLSFPLTLTEVTIGAPNVIGALTITPYRVRHDDRAGPCLAYRIVAEGRTLAYSGDTEWVDALIEVGREADLFICECYTYEKPVKAHTNLKAIARSSLAAKRLVLTHMSDDMLARRSETSFETAEDGLIVDL
jgi:ribonuclease BN (tRNA processing enzyme)